VVLCVVVWVLLFVFGFHCLVGDVSGVCVCVTVYKYKCTSDHRVRGVWFPYSLLPQQQTQQNHTNNTNLSSP